MVRCFSSCSFLLFIQLTSLFFSSIDIWRSRVFFWLSSSFRNNCYVYPLDHHHHHSHSHMRCNCDSTTTYNEQTTTTTRQSTHSPCPLFNNSTNRLKKRPTHEKSFKRYLCSWKTMAMVFLLTTLCFLTSTIYLSMLRFYHPTVREINQTNGKNRQENIFYGSFDRCEENQRSISPRLFE